MPGYMWAIGPCWSCRRIFGFDPDLVPSLIPPGRTEKEAICRTCMDRANAIRASRGEPPHEILPGAYADEDPS